MTYTESVYNKLREHRGTITMYRRISQKQRRMAARAAKTLQLFHQDHPDEQSAYIGVRSAYFNALEEIAKLLDKESSKVHRILESRQTKSGPSQSELNSIEERLLSFKEEVAGFTVPVIPTPPEIPSPQWVMGVQTEFERIKEEVASLRELREQGIAELDLVNAAHQALIDRCETLSRERDTLLQENEALQAKLETALSGEARLSCENSRLDQELRGLRRLFHCKDQPLDLAQEALLAKQEKKIKAVTALWKAAVENTKPIEDREKYRNYMVAQALVTPAAKKIKTGSPVDPLTKAELEDILKTTVFPKGPLWKWYRTPAKLR